MEINIERRNGKDRKNKKEIKKNDVKKLYMNEKETKLLQKDPKQKQTSNRDKRKKICKNCPQLYKAVYVERSS